MALEIKNERIVGRIDNLQEKLNGELPINRLELLYLVNSWGRNQELDTNENIKIHECKSKECYDLSKLDTSKITDMSQLFQFSEFNGDISNWNTSNVINMSEMFRFAKFFNQALNNWDVSNVTDMGWMFFAAYNFNQALDNWDVSNVVDMREIFLSAMAFNQALDKWKVSNVRDMGGMFYDTIAFEIKLNNGNPLPEKTNELKVWFNNNRDRMLAIETLNKESTPEYKIAVIENKISNNKTTLNELFKEKNIDPNSKVGLELLKVYNDTHDKLKLDLEDLKTQVVDIATNDFNSI